jgi:hypothetical protein
MPNFTKGGLTRSPFGVNRYLRSTRDCKFKSYTVAAGSVPYESIDGTLQKLLQPGTVMAKITTGPDSGKIGPYQASGTAEVQTLTPTAVTAGTFTITITRPADSAVRTTAPIAWNATQAQVLAALVATGIVLSSDIALAGAATVNAGAITFTFYDNFAGNVAQMTVDTTNLTATSLVVTTTTGGVAGAADGRQLVDNIVGINDTFLPWQMLDGDREIAILYTGMVVQGWCFELNVAGQRIALTNTTKDSKGTGASVPTDVYVFRGRGIDILFD